MRLDVGRRQVLLVLIAGLVALAVVAGVAVAVVSRGPSTPKTAEADAPADYSSDTNVPWTTGPAKSTSTVRVSKLDARTRGELIALFVAYEGVPASCPVTTVSTSVWLATIKKTGESWAVAGFKEQPSCVDPGRDVNGNPLPPSEIRGFDRTTLPPELVFEREAGDAWVPTARPATPSRARAPLA